MKKVIIIAALVLAIIVPAMAYDPDYEPGYTIKKGEDKKDKFWVYDHGFLPAECFGPLMSELNGDDITAAIFVTNPIGRGCMNANIPYPGNEDVRMSYEIVDQFATNFMGYQKTDTYHYVVKVCQTVNGSMGSFCDSFQIRFSSMRYFKNGQAPGFAEKALIIWKEGEKKIKE